VNNENERMRVELEAAKTNESPLVSMRLIRECAENFIKSGVSQPMIDAAAVSYLEAYAKFEEKLGHDMDLCMRVADHAFDMISHGSSHKTIEKLREFCSERGLQWSVQRVDNLLAN
jgi:hypothetical protein